MVRMLKHSRQQMTLQSTTVSSPPKPPSWRDFTVAMKTRSSIESQPKLPKGSKSLEFTDLSKIQTQVLYKQVCSSCEEKKGVNNVNNKFKRSRAKFHRTQSEKCISVEDIPRECLAINLADTKPQDIGLRQKNYSDERLYLVDNTLRCRKWLAGIEPIDPTPDVFFSRGPNEAVEMPGETWQDIATDSVQGSQNDTFGQTNAELKNVATKSVSFSEADCLSQSQNMQGKGVKDGLERDDNEGTEVGSGEIIGCCSKVTENVDFQLSHVENNCTNSPNLLSATLSKQGQLISSFHEEGSSSHSLCAVETPVTDYLNKCP
ncbi:uncharacterized protein LOC106173060 [Lingula anatina]|uniref:Uncharacterized protein LOC106173060 n=1 Tax=Lingula anatina TaxID=7574 RepID=A0A1S3JGG7_LINAN|nr:uncharacterized protein LOC106173060 [Lingula anatina]XP_013409492.1 uncharacterized protein LOC106173060 [Lingula anatina]XP_013409493.1 uncharacterized protein LOC106173060 [Lingula anatina]XP_013409494.1 uncharacterized protein LOC106173060 [Lingula anatina]|eukprot:XP_013409491.1 uncharacterized protein LOC106173060 [Lingula anatina]